MVFKNRLVVIAVVALSQLLGIAGCASENTDPHAAPALAQTTADADPDRALDSAALVRRMAPGWNLGDSLDAVSANAAEKVDETSWGNPRVTESLFSTLKRDGIRAIRIPVSWRHHLGPAPDFPIDEAWMSRVQEVVDYASDNGLYAIINLHHDGGGDPGGGAWLRDAQKNYEPVMQKYRAVWKQIAARFRDYPHRLVFESMNEVGFDQLPKSEGFQLLNRINQAFVDLVRASGGNNGTRHLLIAGYWTDFAESSQGTVMPRDPARRTILSVHYYTPSQFCINGERKTWGTNADLSELASKFAILKRAFVDRGTPIILGEYGVITTTEASSRVFWLEHVTKAAFDLGIAPFFWDNGEEYDRVGLKWRTPGLLEALRRATSGRKYTVTKQ